MTSRIPKLMLAALATGLLSMVLIPRDVRADDDDWEDALEDRREALEDYREDQEDRWEDRREGERKYHRRHHDHWNDYGDRWQHGRQWGHGHRHGFRGHYNPYPPHQFYRPAPPPGAYLGPHYYDHYRQPYDSGSFHFRLGW